MAKNIGRASTNKEFLRKLKELSGIESDAAFSRACGKQQSNMHNYLWKDVTPGKKFLKGCLNNLFEWGITPIMEVKKIPERLSSLPTAPGIYVIYDSAANVLYIGQATDFRAEVRQTLSRKIPVGIYRSTGSALRKLKPKIKDIAHHLSLYEVASPHLRHNLEALLLRVFLNQTHNSKTGHFK